MASDIISNRRWVRQKHAAEYTGVSESNLEKRRVSGMAPEFFKVGRVVLYDIAVLDAWISATRRSSTSDIPKAA